MNMTNNQYASHDVYGTGRLDGTEIIEGQPYTRVRYKNGLVMIPFAKVRHVLKASARPLFLSKISPVACANRTSGLTRIIITAKTNNRLPQDVQAPTRMAMREVSGGSGSQVGEYERDWQERQADRLDTFRNEH